VIVWAASRSLLLVCFCSEFFLCFPRYPNPRLSWKPWDSLRGLGLGGGLPISVALMSDFVPPRTHGRLVILIMTAVPIGFTADGLLASLLVSRFGWPALFVAGGALPLAAVPLLLFWLPDSGASLVPGCSHAMVTALFQDDLAWRTVLLWLITTFCYLVIYFILAWMPAILHRSGISPSKAILGTTIYGLGVIVCPPLTALIVDRVRTEVVLTAGLTFGALCVLAIGILDPQFWLLSLLLCGVGVGGGCQAGINTLSALSYPQRIRSTGTGWALGAGRVGTIAGPLIGGLLLGLGLPARSMFIAAAIPALATSILMFLLGRVRHVGSESANG
jgi:MFS transporter, AAHS family, 4-hydroxybenzoate transporter